MAKTKTVVVDAAGHARAIAALSSLEGHFDADGKTRLAEQACDAADDLTPIVPTLPEGAVCFQRDAHAIAVSWREPRGNFCVARIGAGGLSLTAVAGGPARTRPAPCGIILYLLHTWSNR